MGADLILMDIVISHKPTKAFFNKLEKALQKKLLTLTDEELDDWANEIGLSEEDEGLRKMASAVITTAINNLRNPCRDMTWLTLPTRVFGDSEVTKTFKHVKERSTFTVYLTGGMSWGDSPGESYEELYKFNMLFSKYRCIDEVLDE